MACRAAAVAGPANIAAAAGTVSLEVRMWIKASAFRAVRQAG